MELYLVNDLPLLGSCADEPALDAVVDRAAERLAATVPARLTYIGFPRLQRLWARVAATPADVHVLVGTRPDRLWARDPGPAAVRVRTARRHGADGHTGEVSVLHCENAAGPRVCVLDDVLMSGNTVRAVLTALRPGGMDRAERLEVRVLLATSDGVRAVQDAHPGVTVRAELLLDLRPIHEVTVICLADLLFGTLRGQPFLAQTELLRPFLGDDLTPLRRLRTAVTADGGWRGPRW